MSERDLIQPEENMERGENVESTEHQALQDATHEPGARVEETQTFAQAEEVESALGEAMNNAEDVAATPINIPRPGEGEVAATPINIPKPGEGNVAGYEEPGDPPPPPDAEGRTFVADEPDEGPDPYPRVADDPDPIFDIQIEGSTGSRTGNRSEGGGEDGGEATPINLPEMPDDDNEATPINLP